MQDYKLTTDKSWSRTTNEIEETMSKWGVSDWSTNYPKGARWEGSREQEVEDRTVTLTYTKDGKPVSLTMGKQKRAVDNLRVLYICVENMRMNERRGIGEIMQDAYLQIAGPTRERSPWEVLSIYPGSPLNVAEAAYKAAAVKSHPDAGGSDAAMRELNDAIQKIREGKA